jgi:hypothetical protein
MYSPETLPLRIMDAIGRDPLQCIRQLQHRGLDPTEFHYEQLAEPYESAKG